MDKTYVEVPRCDLETVGDMIDALNNIPREYKLHPLGQKCGIVVDHTHECVYIDDPNWLEDVIIENSKGSSTEEVDYGKILIDDVNNILKIDIDDKVFESDILTPSKYVETYIGESVDIDDQITIEDFDKLIADNHNKWNYPLIEIRYILENNKDVVCVKFATEELRLVEK